MIMKAMKILGEFALVSLTTALATYGLIALLTVMFPSWWGPASGLWIVVPLVFAGQFGLKILFSRDENGKLRSAHSR
jgi:hypothetical protein